MRSNLWEVLGSVFILKTKQEQVRYLDIFCYKTIVWCSQARMHKISKQIFKGHLTHIMSILLMSSFLVFV